MRLDVFLRSARLVSSRSRVKELCGESLVSVNGAVAKAGKEVKVGDQIALTLWNKRMVVEVVSLPFKPVPKREASLLYRVVEEASLLLF